MDHRPLEGFVLAITPFNFTAIAGNLPDRAGADGQHRGVEAVADPAARRALHDAAARGGRPAAGRHQHGHRRRRRSPTVALEHRHLAGIHFTGSTATFQHLWQQVGNNIGRYRTYPRLVGETGGKDFVLAHPSADAAALETALVRGAFEYQGQKCSAASRAYVPRSLWEGGLRDSLAERVRSLTYGDVTDLSNFGGAVIDRRAFDRLAGGRTQARPTAGAHRAGRRQGRRQRGVLRRPDRDRRRPTRCTR